MSQKLWIVLTVIFSAVSLYGQTLVVKPDREAIVRHQAFATSPVVTNLPPGTQVAQIGQIPYWYSVQLPDNRVGWSPKRNFDVVTNGQPVTPPTASVTPEILIARSNALKIIIIDVEVGDATLIICPEENNRRDVILIDTGENDSDRIRQELTNNGFTLSTKPITRFIISHYDRDHFGHAPQLVPLAEIVYDHGNNNLSSSDAYDSAYQTAVNAPSVDRRTMTLDYEETFSGGVVMKCVAVNQATDFDANVTPSSGDDNPNSIALIISYNGFDYFTAGDLTRTGESSLDSGIQNCDVYHVNHHGSSTTSSTTNFVRKLDPEVSLASNGRSYGHPSDRVGRFITQDPSISGKFFQTNRNPNSGAYQNDPKFVADDDFTNSTSENTEGARGTIKVIVDPLTDKYYILMRDLPLNDGTFPIER